MRFSPSLRDCLFLTKGKDTHGPSNPTKKTRFQSLSEGLFISYAVLCGIGAGVMLGFSPSLRDCLFLTCRVLFQLDRRDRSFSPSLRDCLFLTRGDSIRMLFVRVSVPL